MFYKNWKQSLDLNSNYLKYFLQSFCYFFKDTITIIPNFSILHYRILFKFKRPIYRLGRLGQLPVLLARSGRQLSGRAKTSIRQFLAVGFHDGGE